MSPASAPCTGCAHAQRRLRLSKPALHCLRFHAPAVTRCLDYRSKPAAIAAALNYLKRSSIK